jgi:hypothetical protein
MRVVVIGLGVLSILLLGWTVLAGLGIMNGRAPTPGYFALGLVTATVSVVTHVLATLRIWLRR